MVYKNLFSGIGQFSPYRVSILADSQDAHAKRQILRNRGLKFAAMRSPWRPACTTGVDNGAVTE